MIRILIVDDHPLILEGLRSRLERAPDIKIIGEARDGDEALTRARADRPDILVLDISLPGKSGLEVLRQLHAELPMVRVLILSTHPEIEYVDRSLSLGAWGYLTKNGPSEELLEAIRTVNRGHKYVGSVLVQNLATEDRETRHRFPHEALSDREFQILCLLGQGKTLTQIAESLSISTSTVGTHRARILGKMNLNTTAELVKYAVEHKLVDF
ncbi:MAG TPA: response regulator transcription factor [Bacteroidota bacterium]|nr:response regulator transcription factor [Bacteroidota bacterium]